MENRHRGMAVNPAIFREYDIRGVVDRDLNPELANLIGKAFGSYLLDRNLRKIVVGHDNRLSSEEYTRAAIDGLLSTGCDVIEVGLLPTPVLYFSIVHYRADGGLMITGSHNPIEYNGFKMCEGTLSLMGDEVRAVGDLLIGGRFKEGQGQLEKQQPIEIYLEYMWQHFQIARPLKIVVDAGNGVTGLVGPRLFQGVGCEVDRLFCDLDGTFPNHLPDPEMPANVMQLSSRVREIKADIGIAYDGDGDRVGIIDENGVKVDSDRLLMLFAVDLLSRHPGTPVIFDVKCSQLLVDVITAHGGKPIMWRTGHSLIKRKMKSEGALLAGEMSGHMFFGEDYFGFDDGIYGSILAVKLLSQSGQRLSDLFKQFPKLISTEEKRLPCPDERKFEVVDQLHAAFQSRYQVISIDGARIIFEHGWGLIRASNTHGMLTVRAEAENSTELTSILQVIYHELQRFPEVDLSSFYTVTD